MKLHSATRGSTSSSTREVNSTANQMVFTNIWTVIFSQENSYSHTYLKAFSLKFLVKTFSAFAFCLSSFQAVVFPKYFLYIIDLIMR